jgi:hypothetical protein
MPSRGVRVLSREIYLSCLQRCLEIVINEDLHNSGRDQREWVHCDMLPSDPPARRNFSTPVSQLAIGDVTSEESIEGVFT